MSPDGRKALVACAVIDGSTVPCPEVVLRTKAAEKASSQLGLDAQRLRDKAAQISDVHLQELKAHGQIGQIHQRRQR